MRVSVFKDEKGELSVLIQASVGRGLAPVLIKDITQENLRSKVLPVVAEMRRPKKVTPSDL